MAKGRKPSQSHFENTIADGSAEQAMLQKQDEIIDLLKALTAKLDADAGVADTNYAALITNSLNKVVLK